MLETKISQVAQQQPSSPKPLRIFPQQLAQNPKGHLKIATHRNENDNDENEKVQPTNEVEEEEKEKPYVPHPPYKPLISSLQRFSKFKINEGFKKYVEILKKPYTNIHFTKAMSQIPSSAKSLKEILSNEINLDDNGMVALNKECSAIIQNKLPLKLKDPGSFSILCVLRNMSFEDVYYAILGIA